MSYKSILLNILFPRHCVICETPDSYLCKNCFGAIPIRKTNLCPVCQNIETFAGRVCNVCENEKRKIYLDGLIIASYYKNPVLRETLFRFKYNFIQGLSFSLAKVLAKKILSLSEFPFTDFTLVPIPLHPKRQLWRGFNQAALLVKKLQLLLDKKEVFVETSPTLLIREKNSKPQMKIKSTLVREKNIVGSFIFNKAFTNNTPKKIILVDDIATTGATLNECAKILKRHGAEKVWGLVLGRQGY
ncbi:MAG: ComF family protein [Candidatus Moranbacteria bacterium]|nr:ComF family protein [Candidatus Moranbacteria bacterium]